ncbi:hypothetical protein P7H60_11305 [Vagococcus carniphilus]|uniref:hypothetical protein n=1 Tax=Vagococcus carniphilus TaxID=218144 RepID=UPI00288F7CC3|nr:hypothetical protein [Vagococcus carniphilus]MDT2849728.1 hypothetical protein [Vagococcus carniphilus]
MKKIKTFYGKLDWIENEINDFLEDGHTLEDIKQSLDQDDLSGTHALFTVVYTDKIDAAAKVKRNLEKYS